MAGPLEPLPSQIDCSRIENFIGYGNPEAPIVFIGTEERLAASDDLRQDLLALHVRPGDGCQGGARRACLWLDAVFRTSAATTDVARHGRCHAPFREEDCVGPEGAES
jgi:hypothetical protein